jgi:site-specific DNA recombinase
MMVKPKYRTLLKTQMIRTFNKSNKENAANAALLKRNYEDISHKIERLEERYVLEEITQDIYLKYRERFKQERLEIYQRLQESSSHRSNLEEIVETVLDYAGKLPETWVDSPFAGKQKLQNVVFPAGITYNKKTDQVRTTLLNPTFCWIAQQQQEAGHEKSGISHLGLSYAALVENTGVEPVTFCMPCKRSSQLS